MWQAITGVIIMVTVVLGLFFMLPSSPTPAYADNHTAGPTPTIASCTIIKQAGINIQFQCTDSLGNVIPAGQITVEPQVIVSEIIKNVPGPTVTATVRVPGAVKTVRVTRTVRPAPVVKTFTVVQPQATVTRTLPPKPRATRTVTETAPVETVTATATPRQEAPTRGRLDDTPGLFGDSLNFGDGNTTIVEAGIGVGLAIILALIALSLLHGGFILGYKSSEKADTNFIRAMRDQLSRRQH